MIIARAPLRIVLFGAGSDFPAWWEARGGLVVGGAIDRYTYASARPLPRLVAEYRHRVVWSRIEQVRDAKEVTHPAMRAGIEAFLERRSDWTDGVELVHAGDLPARAGLGSASSFAVAMIAALSRLAGAKGYGAVALAEGAIHLQHDILREAVGWSDVMFAAQGGFGAVEYGAKGGPAPGAGMKRFRPDGEVEGEIERSLLLVHVGGVGPRTDFAPKAAEVARVGDGRIAVGMAIAEAARKEILAPDFDVAKLGGMLREACELEWRGGLPQWWGEVLAVARSAGAWGGRVLTEGGGGFVAILAPPGAHEAIKDALRGLVVLPVKWHWGGCRVIESTFPVEAWYGAGR